MKSSKLWFSVFVFPILFAFIIVVIIPMFMGIYYSFTDWNGIVNDANWVGLSNYVEVIKNDEAFMNSFIFTGKFALVSVLTINLIGFGLALLVTRNSKLNNLLRSIFFMPNLIGGLILGFVWQFIFTKTFDSIGGKLGLSFLEGWLSTTSTGFWGLVILMSWQLSGYMMIIYIAALQSIPDSLKEAAKIDGANAIQRLKNITIPLVAPAFTVGLFLTLSNSFKLFDQNLSLTNGGPHNSTQMLSLNIYKTAFTFNKFGLAQAKAVIFLITVAVITLTQIYYSKKREVEM
ncbi:carbohydrate ABC transporter permease [Paramaledivibacter caminithermalis]|jgi:raffinose/stachyose/melibiose transport system permease protein|uniref:Carbohydrate ABC transporter membrane protein 1, CUT1 family (TC 3.A.1.1.-) n=1 Tax=Paramaledivibacter caminithermalis (strain DSM 15212 / CIP 107654 / DViRD3) TaxID=1121301 RepID=A0A1M6LNN6_PARC5|nr:sugar ABC transporter permease [Paramaledivibacter caminithermalis]SHJ72753.1 carbohydrate ABC transporter membrane protein 1, CUT1 family (TC 3.A.1.1.-) [Paramaledivibacter caminithermalis DSM 15212]